MENVRVIKKILIANRGEIACRIIRTARQMGIATVAIYAESDINAPFVKEADAAIGLTGQTPGETYLDTDQVLRACKTSGADALHPGYGFLSENTGFARVIEDNGITFIGPSVTAIDKMGDKLSAKKIMTEAGVPTLPAIELSADADVSAAAEKIGYPVLVKATAGGGGRGMRVVDSVDQLADAVASAKREAGAAFGNDTLFLERWLTSSRHVEIQILGDQQGNVVHCFERECSIQRRHQKIIEEAPSPAVTAELRQAMGAAAVSAAQSLGYYSTGTVEFLLDGDEFWFLEVNTRLQVEHPVTEEITGIDLVREQIRVAEGATLSFNQSELTFKGHAIEARLYAENPENNFLPSPGTVVAWKPSSSGNARFDSGIESGSIISTQFDPMIAKVIVHAQTRQEAIIRLARALETTRIQGLVTNRDFLVSTLRTAEFLAGDTTTDFIDRVNPDRVSSPSLNRLVFAAIAAMIEARARRHATAKVLKTIPRGWRNSHLPPNRVS
ncbi:MAG: ATP-grasp domain-containing protein, partial [Gammaproteobacteria bacterium]|nr:ATP-grasp domain-containing protein [Gammaproteobacteria bacterium]